MNTSRTKQPDSLQLAKALLRAGVAEDLILKAVSISQYQIRKLKQEINLNPH